MLTDFTTWLNDTSLSLLFKTTSWLVPASQAVHILAVAVVFSSFVLLAARAFGVTGRTVTISEMHARFLPWVWVSIVVLLVTGIIQIIAEPGRALINPFFQAKMGLLLVVMALVYQFQSEVRRDPGLWAGMGKLPARRRVIGAVVVGLTLVIIFCGRWIAYSDAPRV